MGLTATSPARALNLEALPQAATGGRLAWLDRAKGIGIVLVVTGHALGGLIDSPSGTGLFWFRELFLAIYTFHMPLFFVLSGLLVGERLAKNPRAFAVSTVKSFVPAYFIWSVIQYSIIYAAGSAVNRPVSSFWPVVLELPWSPLSQFWFIYVLFIFHMLAFLLLPRIGGKAFLAICVLAKILVGIFAFPADVISLICVHAASYAVGVVAGRAGAEQVIAAMKPAVRRTALAIFALLAVIATTVALSALIRPISAFLPLSSAQIAHLGFGNLAIPAALSVSASVITFADTIGNRVGDILAYLGRNSMAIYVLHVIFIAGTRIVLGRLFGLHAPTPLLAILIPVGLAAPLILYQLAKRIGINGALGLRG